MLDYIVLGAVQGVAEWLPISSEGALVLVQTLFLNSEGSVTSMIETALFLHLGTVLAALVYFRKDIVSLCKSITSWSDAPTVDKNTIIFLTIGTLVSGVLGYSLLQALEYFESLVIASAAIVIGGVGVLLLVTGILQCIKPAGSQRTIINLRIGDGILLGIVQGLAALPGLSRSGLTVSALLMRKFEKETALRLSFLMSIPIVIAGNIVLNIKSISFTPEALVGVFVAFVVGLSTVAAFMRVARKVQFGYFVIGFGVLMIVSIFL